MSRKVRAYEEYSQASKISKKSIKADEREYMNIMKTETVEVVHQWNLRELYTNTKKLCGKFGKPERPVKDKGGYSIPDEEGPKTRWMEHFEELLNRPAPQDWSDIPPANDDLPVDCHPPTKKENIPGHQTAEEWRASRTRQYPSRGIQNGYRNQCGAIVPPLLEDVARRTSPIRMEGRLPH